MKYNYLKTFLFLNFALILGNVYAQGPPPPPPPLPIDGGIFALVILAIGYGVKKLRDHR